MRSPNFTKARFVFRVLRFRWRQDRLPILLYLLTFVVMSYPFILRMRDHLPLNNVDTHQALWQNWWVLEALTQGYDINHVHLLFHPTGLDHTLQPPRWTGWLIWMPLYLLFGDPFAFNLTAAIGVMLRAYGMYLFGLMLFRKRVSAWVCGAFYAFAAANLTHALQQPFTGASEWIPWFMLAFVYGLSQLKRRYRARAIGGAMILAAFLFSLNVYANLKIGIFAMLLGGGFVLLYMMAHQLWRLFALWRTMVIFAGACVVFCMPVLLPILQSDELIDATSDPVVGGIWGGMDLLAYVKTTADAPIPEDDRFLPLNYLQPIASLGGQQLEMTVVTQGLSHIGVVSLVFAAMGVIYAIRIEREVLIWVVLAAVFWLLSLGVEFYVNVTPLDFPWMPYRFLEDNLIFRTLKWPFRMTLVFLFPFSVLIGYGLHTKLKSLRLDWKNTLTLVVSIIMLLYGASVFPIPTRSAPRPQYLAALAELPAGAVIDVPFGRHSSKYYMSVQRFHQRPIAEGMIARVPPGTYNYIESNLLLRSFHDPGDIKVADTSPADWQGALDQLLDDGFRYLILHKQVPVSITFLSRPRGWMLQLFWVEPKLYEDDDVIIYDLLDTNAENVYAVASRVFAEN